MPSIITEWHQFHGPLVAFVVTFGLAVMGRFLRVGLLATAAGGAGVVVGWFVVTRHLWMIPPLASVDVLTEFAVVALLIGLLLTRFGQDRHGLTGMVLSALVAAWFLSGAPRHQAALRASWPIALGVAVAVLLFVRFLAGRALDPLRLALAGLTLAAALHIAGTPVVWVQLALVPGLAGLAMLALPAMEGLAALPVAVDIACLSCLSAVALGRLPQLGFGTPDAAALSPLLAIWLMPHASERLRSTGRAAPLAGALLAGVIAVGCVWLARQLLHR
jgi:hypothetical protein